MTIVWFILGLSFLILFHEFGHFIMAKLFNVYVFEFSLFMGPKILQKQIGETKYTLRLFPIGGYCSMAGELDSQADAQAPFIVDDNPNAKPIVASENAEKPKVSGPAPIHIPFKRTMMGISKWKQIAISFAGPFFNIFLCFVLLTIYYSGMAANGSAIVADTNSPTIEVTEYAFASKGLLTDDVITEITATLYNENNEVVKTTTNENIASFADFTAVIDDNVITGNAKTGMTQVLSITVERNDNEVTIDDISRTFDTVLINGNDISMISPSFGYGYTTQPIISISEDSLMDEAGIMDNDIVTEVTATLIGVNGTTVLNVTTDSDIGTYNEISNVIQSNLVYDYQDTTNNHALSKMSQRLDFTINRNGTIINKAVSRKLTEVTFEGDVLTSIAPAFGFTLTELPIISVIDNPIFYQAGIRTNDVLSSFALQLYGIDGTTIREETALTELNSFNDLANALDSNLVKGEASVGMTQSLDLTIIRDGQEITFNNIDRTLSAVSITGSTVNSVYPVYGFNADYRPVDGFIDAMGQSLVLGTEMGGMIYSALGGLFTPSGLNNISGVIGMYSIAETYSSYGPYYFIFFIGMISVNLGLVNLLPFPALDGGRIVLLLIEIITRKKVPAKVEGIINAVGFGLLLLLIIFVTVKDIIGLVI